MVLDEESDDRGAPVPVEGHERLGQPSADLRGRLASEVVRQDRYEPVIKRGEEQVADPDPLKRRRLHVAKSRCWRLDGVHAAAVDVSHNSDIAYVCYVFDCRLYPNDL